MKTHAIFFRPSTLHLCNVGTKHTGFVPARLHFTRVILANSPYRCVATPTGFCHGGLGILCQQMIYVRQARSINQVTYGTVIFARTYKRRRTTQPKTFGLVCDTLEYSLPMYFQWNTVVSIFELGHYNYHFGTHSMWGMTSSAEVGKLT